MKNTLLSAAGALFGALFLTLASPAEASLADCGNVRLEASAQCEATGGIDCRAQCDDLSFEAACAGKLEVECNGECNLSAEASCTASCTGTCQADCMVRPPQFDCQASCEADATATCSGQCSAAANRAQCEASCKTTFSAHCDASCQGTPPSASCEAKCQAKCEGSCEAKVNANCQVTCQNRSFAQCTADLNVDCSADCDTEAGALVCDGEYVDYENNFEKCRAALRAALNIEVMSSGSASCMTGSCMAEGEASASCAFGPASRSASGLEFVALGAALAAGLRRRRR